MLGLVCDGWSGKPSPLLHQLLLLPFAVVFGALLYLALRSRPSGIAEPARRFQLEWIGILLSFEVFSIALIVAEARHFHQFDYRLTGVSLAGAGIVMGAGWLLYVIQRRSSALFVAVVATQLAGFGLSVADFPLNYLRSDMLPVIGWADQRLLSHLNPYGTMRVGLRLYDFPYLPGMLVAYLPAAALHLDLRLMSLVYLLGIVGLIWWSARPDRGSEVAASLGVFLLCPFLQYRHDLYLQPHWFLLVLAVVLMQQGKFLWSAAVWGMSCAVYQLSWVIFPFVVLHAYRRGRIREAAIVMFGGVAGALLLAGPFLRSAGSRISSNTVGQWSRLPHALADPINVSYWLTYLVRPDQLKWLQALVLVGLFGYCCAKERCASLADTLRWMVVGLAVFIPMNVLVDGYFYLTLLLMLLLYVCVANEWWREPHRSTEMTAARAMRGV